VNRLIVEPDAIEANGQEPEPQLTCKTCRHWHKGPTDPMNLGANVMGECRGGPPVMVALGVTPQGQVPMQTCYPKVPHNFLACGLYDDGKAKDEAA
jgi:hypothetical protein